MSEFQSVRLCTLFAAPCTETRCCCSLSSFAQGSTCTCKAMTRTRLVENEGLRYCSVLNESLFASHQRLFTAKYGLRSLLCESRPLGFDGDSCS